MGLGYHCVRSGRRMDPNLLPLYVSLSSSPTLGFWHPIYICMGSHAISLGAVHGDFHFAGVDGASCWSCALEAHRKYRSRRAGAPAPPFRSDRRAFGGATRERSTCGWQFDIEVVATDGVIVEMQGSVVVCPDSVAEGRADCLQTLLGF